jgi:hypothetical protein
MSEVSVEELAPYLNPDYWSGHSLGYGEAVTILPKADAAIRTPRPIRHTFEERIASMERVIPIETFNSGETFDASNYHEGTVVMFREEELQGDTSQLGVDVEALKGQPIPPRPTEFALALGREASQSVFLTSGNARYINRVYCGMVGKRRDDEGAVYAASASLIERFGGGKVMAVGALWWSYRMPIKIADTVHAKTKRGELVHRVNLLEVVAYGERERKREKSRGLAGRLAYRQQGA